MRKLAIVVLLVSALLGCGVPAYAKHHHLNKEARQAQKRNKARAKQQRKEARALQKSRSRTHQ